MTREPIEVARSDTTAESPSARKDAAPDESALETVVDRRGTHGTAVAPKRFGRFELLSVLGEGAFGTVYRARDPQLDRLVALKVPRRGVLSSDEDRARFLREAQAAASLNHPHICPVHDVGESDGRPYIVMAFIEGLPLSKVVEGHKVQARQATAVVRKLALALDEAHRRGIVHRDLKPANVMINTRGEPVVMDFGLARLHKPGEAHITQDGTVIGSPAYMPPEQALGELERIGPASDIYSLGVILYELLTGRRPYSGSVVEVLGQILHVTPDPPSVIRPGLDPRLEAICLKAMAKPVEDRYATMSDFAAALTDYLKDSAADAASNSAAATEAPSTAGGDADATFDPLATLPFEPAPPRVLRQVRVGSKLRTKSTGNGRGPAWKMRGACAAGLLIVLSVVLLVRTPQGTLRVRIDDPDVQVEVKGTGVVITGADAEPVTVGAGEHRLVVTRGDFTFETETLVLRKGDELAVKVELVPGAVQVTADGHVIGRGELPDVQPVEAPAPPAPMVAEVSPASEPGASTVAAADRRAAEWVLSLGGRVIVVVDSTELEVESGQSLPAEDLELRTANLNGRLQEARDLSPLRGMRARTVGLAENGLTDDTLAVFSLLPELRELDLADNPITDEGLSHLKGCARLEVLHLRRTRVTEAGLIHLTHLRHLKELDLGQLAVSDEGLSTLGDLPMLEDVSLAGCSRLTGAFAEDLWHLPLKRINLHTLWGYDELTPEGISALAALPSLETLVLKGRSVEGDALRAFERHPTLRQLNLSESGVGDESIPLFRSMPRLTYLDLQNTWVSPEGFAALRATLPNCKIVGTPRGTVDAPEYAELATGAWQPVEWTDEWLRRMQRDRPEISMQRTDRGLKLVVDRVVYLSVPGIATARDVAIRAMVRKHRPEDHFGLLARYSQTGSYKAHFNDTRRFAITESVGGEKQRPILSVDVPRSHADWFQMTFVVIGDRQRCYANGRLICEVQNSDVPEIGAAGIAFRGELEIRDLEVMVLDETAKENSPQTESSRG